MAEIIEEKIRVGISACNAGAKVRYNRAGWDRLAPLGRERDGFIWTPVCPEVMAGLGVPRHPIRLVSGNGDDFWQGTATIKNKQGMEVTEQCKEGSLACSDAVRRAGAEAFVFMEGSPTCGVYRTTLKNKRLGKPPGVFGSLLLKEELFLVPALDLESPLKWWDWRRRLHAFAWLKRREIETKNDMYDAWHLLKFLCQEVDERRARELGREIAELPKHASREEIGSWKRETLFLLRKPSDIKRIETAMNKHFAYYRKHINPEAGEMVPPDREMAKYKFVAELLQMEKKAVLEDFLFAGTPVIYRGRVRY
jgi:uncharacterized protein YbbK (DUF523 family)